MALDDLIINHRYTIPGRDLELAFSRSSGAGGQNVNKVNTRAELRFNLGENTTLPRQVKNRLLKIATAYVIQGDVLLISSQVHRSQLRNIEECYEKLRSMAKEALHRPKPRVATKPSRSAKRRRVDNKTARGKLKRSRSWKPGDS